MDTSTSPTTPQKMATISLRFSSTAKPLKLMAFSDLVAKGLYLIDRPARLGFVAQQVGEIIGIPRVDHKFIGEALENLKLENKVHLQGNKWVLTADAKSHINKQIASFDSEIDSILVRHFPKNIDPSILKDWFILASADFFAFHGEDWVKAVSKNGRPDFSKTTTIQKILQKSLSRYLLEKSKKELIDGFVGFFTSEDVDDQKHIMNLGFAMFSSKLVAADIGSDPITVEELRDATFILDTNILFAIGLEGHRLSKSMKALGKAFKTINSKLIVLHTTAQEYKAATQGARKSVIELLKTFPEEIVLGTADDFLITAKRRGCETTEDLIRFFDEIKNLPSEIESGPKIEKIDFPDIATVVTRGEIDASLKAQLQSDYLKLNPDKSPKGDLSLRHDAALVHVVEYYRGKTEKCWVMTLDRTLQATSMYRAGNHAVPTAIFLEGLIQILAVHNGGPDHSASDFAPLLTRMIMKRCLPTEKTYTKEDLTWLYSIQERSVDFSPVKIKQLLDIVTRSRLAGMTADDDRLKLAVDRAYQEVKREYEQELSEAKEDKREADNRAQEVEQQLLATQKKLIIARASEIIREAKIRLFKKVVIGFIPSAFIAFVFFYFSKKAFPENESDVLGYFSSLIGLAIPFWILLKTPLKQFNETKSQAREQARKETLES